MEQRKKKDSMKKILTLMLALAMVFTGMGFGNWGIDTAWADEAVTQAAEPWDGTEISEPAQVDGVYQIGTGAELAWFAAKVNDGTASDANAVLTKDIDLGSKEWTPIGSSTKNPYLGTFDGKNHTINNLSIKDASFVGFFGVIGKTKSSAATIRNLTISGTIEIRNVQKSLYIGGVCGYMFYGKVLHCNNNTNIVLSESSKSNVYAGGICGFAGTNGTECVIDGCTNSGNIDIEAAPGTGKAIYAAGIAGKTFKITSVNASKNQGAIAVALTGSGTANYAGIVANVNTSNGFSSVNACYNIGKLEGTKDDTVGDSKLVCGSVIGSNDSSNETDYPTNCSYLEDTASSGVGNGKGGDGITAKSEVELKSDAFLAELNGADSITDYIANWTRGADEYPEVSNLTQAEGIKSFKIGEVKATIDRQKHTITAELPEGTDLTKLAPTITCFGDAMVTPASGVAQDFTSPVEYKVGNITYTVTLTVYVPAFTETGSETDPYIINSAEKLLAFSKEYNANPNKYKGAYWEQTEDIDMIDVLQDVKFTPIGVTTAFSGFYDGGNKKIKNLTISSGAEEVGLFGKVTDDSVLKNIVLDKSCSISGSAEGCNIGALAGRVNGTSTIENCTNYAAVTSNAPVTFGGSIPYAGGLIGSLGEDSKVINCKNYGTVAQTSAHDMFAGGIVGHQGVGTTIAGCENHGTVTAASASSLGNKKGSTAGGITADTSGGYISGCYNDAAVSAGMQAGGITGRADSGKNQNGEMVESVIESCYNLGSIIGNASDADAQLGGIAGNIGYTILNNCYHAGSITANSEAQSTKQGAIMGGGFFGSEMKGNYFLGTTLSEAYGSVGLADTPKKSNFRPMEEDDMKDGYLLALLKAYTEPYSLYQANWAADENNSNQGYPKFSKVEKILSHFAEMKSFTVTIGGTEYKGVINGTDINIVLPAGTKSITPTMTVSDKATVDPASGTEVTLQDGTAQFTVTAENRTKSKVYTLQATVPQDANGLAALKLAISGDNILASTAFSQSKTEYDLALSDAKVVGQTLLISAIPAASGAKMTAKLNDGAEVNLTAASSLSERSGSIELWKSGAQTQPVHVGANTLTITVTPAGSSEAAVYTININIQPTLSALSVKNGEEELAFDKAFDGDVTEYSLDVWDNVESLTLSAKERMTGIAQVTLPAEASEDGTLAITNLNSFKVKVGDEQTKTTYTVTLHKKATYKAEIAVTPKDAIVVVLDAAGKTMQPNADGSYTLLKEETYTARAAKAGYRTVEQTFTEASLKDGKLTLTLNDTSSPLPSFTGDWTSFRGSDTNNGVTAAKTPKTANAAKELWAVRLGAGYTSAPTPQLLINGHLYLQSSNYMYILNPKTGETLKSAKLMGTAGFSTNPIAYGGGMIFVYIEDGNESFIQALNAETLESLWVSEKVSGQLISPMTYHDGYLYTGTWVYEDKIGSYFMLSATDENPAQPDETKKLLWTLDHKGGFYWAGAYATDNYVVFGSDDGAVGSDSESAVLYSVNPANGAVISKITGLKGDIRSSIAYKDGYVYFTTKAAILYRVAIDADGKLGEVKSFDMGSKDGLMSTGTPVISDGVVFVSRNGKGTDQFSGIGAVYAIDAQTMEEIAKVDNDGYIQSSMLLTTAYKDSDNALYLYATYNKEPGGMLVIKYDLEKKTLSKEAIYTPTGEKAQYNICSPIADASGNIYFKNDSGYIFAIGARAADETVIAKVNFVLNGGSAIDITEGTEKTYYQSDDGKTLPIPSKSGYTFKGWFSEDNNTSETSKQYTQVSAGLPSTLYAIWEKTASSTPSGDGNIRVSFRLIGAEQATQMVDLNKDSYLPNYVTWIATKHYTVPAGTTVGEIFKKATAEAGIEYVGYEKNYISTMKAPASLGGYWIGEFDNGKKSGWMYTVRGTHPNKGLVEWVLNDGDDIVWHYVNDYSFEVEDWFDDPDYPSLAHEKGITKYYNGWLKAADRVGSAGGGIAAGTVEEEVKNVTTDTKTGTTTAPTEVKVSEKTAADGTKEKVAEVKVSADNQKEILKQAKEKKSNEIILVVSSKEVGDATKADVTLDKSFIDSIVKDTDAKLTIKTPFGDKTYTKDELKAMSEAATGSTITVAIEKAAEQPADDTAKAEKIAKAKSIVKDMKLVARSSKTTKKNIKAVLKNDAKVNASIKELKDLGFTVKYRFYRSTKKAASYKSTVTKKTASYTNTSGKKGTKYFYKVQVRVYDENGKLVAKTALKQCKYASRTWTKTK